MKKTFKIIWTIMKSIFIIVIILYSLFIILNKISTNNSIFSYRIITIPNTSMSSVYKINEVVLVKDVNIHKLKVKDDIAYKGVDAGLDNTIVVSRIEKIEKDDKNNITYTTKGVDTPVLDPPFGSKQVIGKVVGTIPVISGLHRLFKLPLGFSFFIFAPLLIIILFDILEVFKNMKADLTLTKRLEAISNNLKSKKKRVRKNDNGDIEILEDIIVDEIRKNKKSKKEEPLFVKVFDSEPKIVKVVDVNDKKTKKSKKDEPKIVKIIDEDII